jgi:hypothetical protein
MRNLIAAGVIALIVAGLVPAVGAAIMSSLAPMPMTIPVTKATVPASRHPSAAVLTNARAVSWISSGHVVGP